MVAVKIIETMQGNLKIRSVMNKGTTLTITLPKYNMNSSKTNKKEHSCSFLFVSIHKYLLCFVSLHLWRLIRN